MRYGDLVTIVESGIRIDPREIQPIGIFDQSECWGIWLPDRNPDSGEKPGPDHLVVSPFHPDTWPALFRIDLKLRRTSRALCQAAGVLSDLDLNIISYDITPSGHHHLTWSLIAEAVRFTHGSDRNMLDCGDSEAEGQSEANTRLEQHTQEVLAPAMIQFAADAEVSIESADLKGTEAAKFLHPTFVERGGRPAHGSILYDHTKYDEPLRSSAARLRTRAVSCRWLQGLAYVWLYRNRTHPPILFH